MDIPQLSAEDIALLKDPQAAAAAARMDASQARHREGDPAGGHEASAATRSNVDVSVEAPICAERTPAGAPEDLCGSASCSSHPRGSHAFMGDTLLVDGVDSAAGDRRTARAAKRGRQH